MTCSLKNLVTSQSIQANPAAPLAKARKADPIPDDWDNDDNDYEEDPEKVWEAAYVHSS